MEAVSFCELGFFVSDAHAGYNLPQPSLAQIPA